MEAMDRQKGHFYNWYDTQSLEPLLPLYISSVDSGNLTGHLLTLRSGLLTLPDQKIIGSQLFAGLRDTLDVFADTAGKSTSVQLAQLKKDLASAITSEPTTLMAMRLYLEQLATSATEMVTDVNVLDSDPDSPSRWWAKAFADQLPGRP